MRSIGNGVHFTKKPVLQKLFEKLNTCSTKIWIKNKIKQYLNFIKYCFVVVFIGNILSIVSYDNFFFIFFKKKVRNFIYLCKNYHEKIFGFVVYTSQLKLY